MAWRMRLAASLCAGLALVQAATFGTAVTVAGAPTDLVLDEGRGRLYILNSTQQRVEVYSLAERRWLNPIPTGALPLAAALSLDGRYLYVTCYEASSLDVIDLDAQTPLRRVNLPASPEGVAVGGDGRVLITTIGSGSNNAENRLLIFDPTPGLAEPLRTVVTTLPAPAAPASSLTPGRAYNVSRSRLAASADGRWIIGLNNPTAGARQIFVFETASGSILRSRTVSNISSVLAVAPDGSKFMAGLSLFDTQTLAVLAQQNAANSLYPFPQNANFNTQQNQGGSVFSPDGARLYTAFNIAPVNSTQTNSSQLMINDPDNLLIQMGVQLPENVSGKMVISRDGAFIYALSQSGFLILPVGSLSDYPLAVPDSTAVLLTHDQCGVTAATRSARVVVHNQGRGRMTATAQVIQSGITFTFPLGGAETTAPGMPPGPGAGAPGQIIPVPLPGGGLIQIPPGTQPGATGGSLAATARQQAAIAGAAPLVSVRQSGTDILLDFSVNTGALRSLGTATPTDFLIQSPEAVNIPWRVRVYQNSRNAEAPGTVIPVPVSISTNEGLADIVADPARRRLYIANSGLNRVEVFDTQANRFLSPIKVGQLPRSLALSLDGNRLYVANSGGESISIVDLERGEAAGRVRFPPVPYNAAYAVVTPSVIAMTLNGLQIVMSDGSLWKVVHDEALPRGTARVIGSATVSSPRTLVATPGGEYALLLAGNGVAYLYDAAADDFVLSQQVAATPIQGYYGPVAAGPRGQYFIVNGTLLNASLTPVSTAAVPGGLAATSTAGRVAAVAAVNANLAARFVQPARSTTAATVSDAPVVELVDVRTGMARSAAAALEGPLATQVGTQRVNVGGRTMAVDADGSTAYLLTAAGLTVVPLGAAAGRPVVNPNGVVNGASFQPSLAAGSVVSIFGQNLASQAAASGPPLPKLMGGVCVTLDNEVMPLVMTAPGQINAQIPPGLAAGRHTLVVRAVDRNLASPAQTVTVAKYAPAVYLNSATGQAALFRPDGSPVSKDRPARRDEPLVLYATGLGPTTGGKVTAGEASPADPLAVTEKVRVFFGDPRYKEAEVIVDWSGLAPGQVGLYQINLRVPGAHWKGEALPVTVRVGGVDSPASGPVVPTVAVE